MIADDALIDRILDLLPEMTRLLKSSYAVDPEFAAIPLGQARVLGFLYGRRQATVGEVACGVGVSLPTASELIDRLVEARWVDRKVNPADRRQVFASLTERAVAIGDRVREVRRAQMDVAFTCIPPENRAILVAGLESLVEGLGGHRRPAAATR